MGCNLQDGCDCDQTDKTLILININEPGRMTKMKVSCMLLSLINKDFAPENGFQQGI
jgi:hypothetical protein